MASLLWAPAGQQDPTVQRGLDYPNRVPSRVLLKGPTGFVQGLLVRLYISLHHEDAIRNTWQKPRKVIRHKTFNDDQPKARGFGRASLKRVICLGLGYRSLGFSFIACFIPCFGPRSRTSLRPSFPTLNPEIRALKEP